MAQNVLNNKCDLLVIGGSAGSLDVILHLLPDLRPTISFAIVIVVHRRNIPDTTLADLLSSKTVIPVKEAEEKESILPGNIYIAPPDYHLLIEHNHTLSLDYSEKINYSRPSIDATFESAAEAYGATLTCILLSGANSDGVNGLEKALSLGAAIVVQDPDSAEVGYMPQQAISMLPVQIILEKHEFARFINSLT